MSQISSARPRSRDEHSAGRRDIQRDHASSVRAGLELCGRRPSTVAFDGSTAQPDACLRGERGRRQREPAAEEACVSWVGFHAFRHTAASMLFAEGRNAVQVQRWLGHHSAAFTLATYVHLLDGDIGAPLTLPERANKVQTWSTPLDATPLAEQRARIAA